MLRDQAVDIPKKSEENPEKVEDKPKSKKKKFNWRRVKTPPNLFAGD
jgi:hypothetical protein